MTGWIRRQYQADGVTEYPAGPNLRRLREQFGSGAVVLALDVSSSMGGDRLTQAVAGCRRFIDEAVAAGYQVGLILWHGGLAGSVPPAREREPAEKLLQRAVASGGTDIVPCLMKAHRDLMDIPANDRVVAIFGDGDLGDRQRAITASAKLVADDIRILTCGLGDASAVELAAISTETGTPRAASASTVAESIAGLVTGLSRGRRT